MASENHDRGANSTGHDKLWARPWSSDELRQNAHKWNLAGDSGLLRHLQEFSQNVLTHTHTTGKALDSLVEDINTTATEINNVNNSFLCLANTQFVENRVYEDDDRDISRNIPAVEDKPKEDTDAVVLKKVKQALSMSVAVLDTMFEPVEIQASDSEGEAENDKSRTKTLLLEPHNPYLNRPLPHLIGSEAFMSDDKIGLGETPSDSEDRPFGVNIDVDASSDPESDLGLSGNKRDRDTFSSHSSASESNIHGQHTKKVRPSDHVISSSHITESHPEAQPHPAADYDPNKKFAEQLAAKLGTMAANVEHSSNFNSASGKNRSDDLFGGPPSDEEEDTLFKNSSGLFSGRPKLFDDLEDTNKMFWGTGSYTKGNESKEEPQQTPPVSNENPRLSANEILFGSNNDDDDDDLFSFKQNKSSLFVKNDTLVSSESQKVLSGSEQRDSSGVGDFNPGKSTSTPQNYSQWDDASPHGTSSSRKILDRPSVESSKCKPSSPSEKNHSFPQEKKPPGGVLMFGQASILPGLKDKLPRRPPSPSSSSSSENEDKEKSAVTQSVSQSSKNTHLNSTLQSSVGVSSSSGVVDSQDYGSSSQITFTSPIMSSTRGQCPGDDGYQTQNAFSPPSNDGDFDHQNLFEDDVSQPKSLTNISSGLFADVEDNDDLFADSPARRNPPPSNHKPLPSSIFSEDDYEDLFSDMKTDMKTDFNTSNYIPTPTKTSKQKSETNPQELKPDTSVSSDNTNGSVKTSKVRSSLKHEGRIPDQPKTDLFSSVPPPIKVEPREKTLSLFDDSDSGEDDLLFSSASSAGSRRSQASTDLLSTSAVSTIEKKPLAKKSLFDDDDALFGSIKDEPEVDIFSSSSKLKVEAPTCNPQSASTVSSTPSSLLSKLERAQHDVSDSLFQDVDDSTVIATKPYQSAPKEAIIHPLEDSLVSNTRSLTTNSVSEVDPSQEQPIAKIVSGSSENAATHENISGNNTQQVLIGTADVIPKRIFERRKPEPPRTLDIRKETDPSLSLINDYDDDNNDLFSFASVKQTATAIPSGPSHDIGDVSPIRKPPLLIKPVPPRTVLPKEMAQDAQLQTSKDAVDSSRDDAGSANIKKIKHPVPSPGSRALQSSLKIDPLALLPGAKPPVKGSLMKDSSSGELSEESSPSTSVSSEAVKNAQAIGFDQPISNNATLPTAHKDRAKLGSKRRPPSNKARREAARASQSFESPTSITPVEDESSAKEFKSAFSLNNNILSPSTDEDDLFGVPQDLPPEYGRPPIPPGDIFGGGPVPVLSPASNLLKAPLIQHGASGIASTLIHKNLEADSSFFPSLDAQQNSSLKTSSSSLSLHHNVTDKAMSSDQSDQAADGGTSMLNVDSEKNTASKKNLAVPSAIADVDPLINSEQLISKDEDHVFETQDNDANQDHSSLFPFVKKKSDGKDIAPKPLFSRAPSLPSKVEDCEVNSKPEILDSESDLFSPSGPLQADKTEETTHVLKSSSGKIWQLSDDDDDEDLFLSSAQLSRNNKKQDNGFFAGSSHVSQDSVLKVALDAASDKPPEPKRLLSDEDDDIFTSTMPGIPKNAKLNNIHVTESLKGVSQEKAKEGGTPSLPVQNKSQDSGNGLFGESDSEDIDGLFSKPSVFSVKPKSADISKPSLFDEDDDDLFGSSANLPSTASKGPLSPGPSASHPTGSTSSTLTKLKPETTFDDPLMVLTRDD